MANSASSVQTRRRVRQLADEAWEADERELAGDLHDAARKLTARTAKVIPLSQRPVMQLVPDLPSAS